MKTYDEILNTMKNAYFEKTGENVELISDLGARFQAVASELFSLSCQSDFVLKQAFPQTASGKYLDLHAALRDMERKSANKAFGELTFSINEALAEDITVPAGTVCSVFESPYLQYETDEDGIISAGETSVTVSATALEGGESYNVPTGSVSVMVNPPSGVSSVTNSTPFTGGWDEETDRSLRERLVNSYSVAPTGISPKSIAESIMKLDEVLDCNIVRYYVNTIRVYVKTKNNTLSTALTNKIKNALMLAEIARVNVYVYLADCINYDLNVYFTSLNGNGEEEAHKVEKAIRDYAKSIKISQNVNLSEIFSEVSFVSQIKGLEISSPTAVNGFINSNSTSYLKLDNLTVVYDE